MREKNEFFIRTRIVFVRKRKARARRARFDASTRRGSGAQYHQRAMAA
jgi:hypothetical protein